MYTILFFAYLLGSYDPTMIQSLDPNLHSKNMLDAFVDLFT